MAIADDLRLLAERTSRDLGAVHDFFEHSQFVWDFFRIQVSNSTALAKMKSTHWRR